ncbi:MAG TPA: cupredoxin domain-containing protein [Burkholderiales bacterium]|jgi:cytochrome c oxidase subunit 2|nr:cupredoxin domain-containing protein [Burkholderiales bacterium]
MKLATRLFRIAAGGAALGLVSIATYVAAQPAQPKEKVIRIEAKRFDYTPGELTLKKGEPVILELTSLDVLMGFNLPDLNLRADIVPGKVTRVRFVPEKAGSFTFLCDIFCGSKHEEMNGRLTVIE